MAKAKRVKKSCYHYKGYEITKNEYGLWCVEKLEKVCCLDYLTQYQDKTLKDCKEWIDYETK